VRRRGVFCVALLLSLSAVSATAVSASADGGPTIAGAPSVTYGQQEFGNLTNGAQSPGVCDKEYAEWWLLPAISGDQVTIDWEADQVTSTEMDIYAAGTTDYTVGNVQPLYTSDLNSNGKNQLTLTATRDANLPVEFRVITCGGDTPGPYDFTAYVSHEMVLGLSTVPAALSGAVDVGVHNPDGVALSGAPLQVALQVSKIGVPWTTIGTATPVNGGAAINYSLPSSFAGSQVKFRALGTGAGYLNAASAVDSVRIAAPPCVVPKLIGMKLKAATRALTRAGCALGAVRYRTTPARKRGRVIAQGSRAGKDVPHGARVRVTVGN